MTGHTNNWTPLFTNKGGQFVRNVDFLTKYEYIQLEGKLLNTNMKIFGLKISTKFEYEYIR